MFTPPETWGEGIQAYERYSCLHHAPSTRRGVRFVLEKFGELVQGRPAQKIERGDVEAFQALETEAGASPATVNCHVRYLKAFFSWLVDEGTIEKNPCKRIRSLRVVRRRKPILKLEEIDRLLAYLDKTREGFYADLVRVIANTGLRLGEAVHLKWEDIDLARRLLVVRCRPEYTTKDREERVIPLNDVARSVLSRRMAENAFGWLFAVKGRLWHLSTVTHGLARRARRAGIDGANWYQLRHAFGTRAASEYQPLQLAALMGHADPSTTNRYYVHREELRLGAPSSVG